METAIVLLTMIGRTTFTNAQRRIQPSTTFAIRIINHPPSLMASAWCENPSVPLLLPFQEPIKPASGRDGSADDVPMGTMAMKSSVKKAQVSMRSQICAQPAEGTGKNYFPSLAHRCPRIQLQ